MTGAVNLMVLLRAGGGAIGSTFLIASSFISGSSKAESWVTSTISSFWAGIAILIRRGNVNPTNATIVTITRAAVCRLPKS